MAKARIEVVGDAASFLRALKQSGAATQSFRGDLQKLAVTSRTTARAQVEAAVQVDTRLRAQAAAARELASTYKRGSKERIAADNLAIKSEQRLSRSIAITAQEAGRIRSSAGGSLRGLGKDAERAGRGALYGSGALRSLGRSAFYASGFLLGGVGLTAGLRAIVDTGTAAAAAAGQLDTAIKDQGESVRATRGEIEKQIAVQTRLGFGELDSTKSLTTLERGTRSVTLARKAQILADNISRGGHVALATASKAVARAYSGNIGLLARLVPSIRKGSTATEGLAEAQKAYAGAAARYARGAAGSQDRLTASLERTEVTASRVLLPTITKLSNGISDWLSKSENQARVQRDVELAMHDAGAVAKVLVSIFKTGAPVVERISHELGGAANSLKLLAIGVASFKAANLLTGLAGIAGGAGKGETKVASLMTRLRGLSALKIAPILITVEIVGLEAVAAKIKALQEGYLNAAAAPVGRGAFDSLVPKLAREYKLLQSLAGKTPQQAIETIETRLSGKHVGPRRIRIHDKSDPTGAHDTFKTVYDQPTSQAADLAAAAVAYASNAAERRRINRQIARDRAAGVATGKPTAATGGASTGALTPKQQNDLALATAKTPTAKLNALVDERRIIAREIADVRRKLKTAKGAQADLLISDLTTLEQTDSQAYAEIVAIKKAAAAKKASAARAAAAAARAAARTYAQGVATVAAELTNIANQTTSVAKTRAAYRKLIDYYKRESNDAKLTERQQAHYAAEAIAAKKRLVAQIVKDQRAAEKALETKQLNALGVGKGQTIGQLLDRVKQAASDKEQGISTTGAGIPSVKSLKEEAAQVTAALKGTYLDTSVSRNVLDRIRNVLSGKLGRLNAEMRGKIQQLLTGLKGDLKGFDGFNLTAAERRRRSLDRRFADRYGGQHGGHRGAASTPAQYHWHFDPQLTVVANEPISRALDRSFFKMRAQLARPG